MKTYVELIDLAIRDAEVLLKSGLTKTTSSYDRDQINMKLTGLQNGKMRERLLGFLEFCKACKVKIGKPKVKRRTTYGDGSIEHRGRFVMPDVVLSTPNKNARVESPESLAIKGTRNHYNGGVMTVLAHDQLPPIMSKVTELYAHHYEDYFMRHMADISAAFLREAGPEWEAKVKLIAAHYEEVKRNVDSIVSEHFGKKGDAERAAFQEKLSRCLAQTKGLIDAPPEAICALFKLGASEIETLAKFTHANRADIDLIDAEDITLAQNNARVANVMSS